MVTGCYDDDFEVTEEEEGVMVGAEESEDTLLATEGFDDSLKVCEFDISCFTLYALWYCFVQDVTELLEVSTNLDFSATVSKQY